MGLDAAAFSPKEFGLAIQAEATIGTQVTTGMTRVNVDSVEMPGFNLTQVMEARSGSSGRLSDADDVFVSDKGTVKEISFSGICDTVVLPLLIQNSLATAISSDVTTITSSYTPAELENGEASGIQKTFTLAILAPTTTSDASPAVATNRNMCFPGCTITSLSITGSMDDESGRLKFSATAQTGYQATYNQGSVTVSTAYGGTFYSLATLSGAKTIAGATDSVVQSFSLNIENPSFYSGQSDNNGNPDAIARAIPELNIGMDATVKYDDNTAGYMNAYKSGSNAATLLCNDSGLSQNGTTFGFEAANGRITSVGFNEANAMMLDVSTKFVVSGSTDFFAIHT
tara:strand:+ start:5244 stop:6269 length:1026 start_codon:yes stop_codon:yes gene_type:complete